MRYRGIKPGLSKLKVLDSRVLNSRVCVKVTGKCNKMLSDCNFTEIFIMKTAINDNTAYNGVHFDEGSVSSPVQKVQETS